ncbi:PGF-CTERM sorting domain-containing protein [Halosimplex amylolyticum]|uniref:PGF-CTERM sorting domain-containing protein n=1 Tax=Halosimplex amylolyticum TaxID=3396616 RepID=UPI003F55C6A5
MSQIKPLFLAILLVVVASTAVVQPVTADDDYADRCDDGDIVRGGTFEGNIGTPDDRDALRVRLNEGDYVNIRVLVPKQEDRFHVSIDGLHESISETKNAKPNARNIALNGFNSGVVGSAKIFAEEDGVLCLGMYEFDEEDAEFPYSWNLSIGVNSDAPALVESTPTPSPTATPTDTPTVTATETPTTTPTETPTTAQNRDTETSEGIQDSDGDGVIDAEDYAPRDPEVQEKSDIQATATGSGPGFGAGITLVALLGAALVSLRRR